MERDRQLEQDLLEQIDAPPGLARQVLARLDWAERKYGNTGWQQKLDRLLAEIQEEAADIVGWGIGAAMKLDPARRPQLLLAIAGAGAIWQAIANLRLELAGVQSPAAAPEDYTCSDCRDRHQGPPAGVVPRNGRQVPVCEGCILAHMPDRPELERFWLQRMKAAAQP